MVRSPRKTPLLQVKIPAMNSIRISILLSVFIWNSFNIKNLLAENDLVIADFEGDSYGQWEVTGNAFGVKPANGTLPGQMHVDGFVGKGLANSFVGGDNSIGTLTSSPFKIERRYLTFYIGGGKNIENCYIELSIDGVGVRKATGPNDKPGGTEALQQDFWDVSEFVGKKAVITIVDRVQGGWGHINIDQIVQSDVRPATIIENAKREFKIADRYLNIPIKNGAAKRKVKFMVEGEADVINEIELADSKPDWWAFVDVEKWKGKTVVIEVDKLPESSTALQTIEPSDGIKEASDIYRESLRGQFHFSSRRGWNNDPNGLVFYNGEYHLFYQHNPHGWGWGNMHWGHAVSSDLVHWKELRDELAPDTFGPMFSGSAVVDWNNSSGFGTDNKPPLVLIYTAAGNPTVQCLAYSTDGRNFTKYKGNPVLPQISGGNRDPKVIWHEPTKKWVMVLYVEAPQKKHTIQFFTSSNLRDWKLVSITDGGIDADKFLFECPDFFELAVDGKPNERKWVLTGANAEYAIGTFDGEKFTIEDTRLPGQFGQGFYAAQTFSDLPKKDGRRIQVGWLQTATNGMSFNQSMTIPLELTLKLVNFRPRLATNPIKELESLRQETKTIKPTVITPETANLLEGLQAELAEIVVDFEPSKGSKLEFDIRGARLIYDQSEHSITLNNHRVVLAPAAIDQSKGQIKIRVLCDRTALEVFVQDGLYYIPFPFQPTSNNLASSVRAVEGSVQINVLNFHKLKSAW